MKTFAFLALALFLGVTLSIRVADKVTHLENTITSLIGQVKSKANLYQDLADYYDAYNLAPKAADQVASRICQSLGSVKVDKEWGGASISAFYHLLSAAKCNAQVDESTKEWISTGATSADNVDRLTRSIQLGFEYKLLTDAEGACTQLLEFIEKDGAVRFQKKKIDQINFEYTPAVLEAISTCIQNKAARKQLVERLQEVFPVIISGLQSVFHNALAFAEGDNHARTTASIFASALSVHDLLGTKGLSTALPKVLNFLGSSSVSLETGADYRAFFQAAKVLQEIPVISVQEDPLVASSKNSKLTLSITAANLYGNQVNLDQLYKGGKVRLAQNGNQVGEAPLTTVGQGNYKAEFDYGGRLNAIGFYDVQVVLAPHKAGLPSLEAEDFTKVVTKASVVSIKYDVTASRYAPNALNHEAQNGGVGRETPSANQNSFIHAEFGLQFANGQPFKVTQAAVKLVHPQFQYATNLVQAVYDKESNKYKVLIDLGNPDHALPYNGIYEAELIVGDDLLSEAFRWKFAKINISFRKPATGLPPRDSDYKTPSDIHHAFPEPRKAPSSLLTLIFDGGIVLCGFIFLGVLGKIGVNFDGLPQDGTQRLLALVFLGLVGAVLGILVLFWVKINLITTLYYLAAALVLAMIVGNKALANDQQKGDKVKTE